MLIPSLVEARRGPPAMLVFFECCDDEFIWLLPPLFVTTLCPGELIGNGDYLNGQESLGRELRLF